MIHKITVILNAMHVLEFLEGDGCTGNQIAKQVKSFSRSTVYRTLPKMEKIGLINKVECEFGTYWHVTDRGVEFWSSLNELPF